MPISHYSGKVFALASLRDVEEKLFAAIFVLVVKLDWIQRARKVERSIHSKHSFSGFFSRSWLLAPALPTVPGISWKSSRRVCDSDHTMARIPVGAHKEAKDWFTRIDETSSCKLSLLRDHGRPLVRRENAIKFTRPWRQLA